MIVLFTAALHNSGRSEDAIVKFVREAAGKGAAESADELTGRP